jgi:hypothetical protein
VTGLGRAGRLLVAVLLGTVLAPLATAAPASAAPGDLKTVEITTVPPTPAARFTLDGVPLLTDDKGVARTGVPRSAQLHRIELLTPTLETSDSTWEFVRWHGHADSDQGYTPVLDNVRVDHTLRLKVAFRESRRIAFSFVDQANRPVDPARVDSITLRSDTGRSQELPATDTVALIAVRPTVGNGQLVAREATYSVQSVSIDGTNVVNVGEQRFRPSQVGSRVAVVVLLRSARFRVQDRLLGTPIATVVHLDLPDGTRQDHPTDASGELVLENLARGTYTVSVAGQAYSIQQELALSRSQFVDIYVLSHFDATVLGAAFLLGLVGLLALGRWRSMQPRAGPAEPAAATRIPAGAVGPG